MNRLRGLIQSFDFQGFRDWTSKVIPSGMSTERILNHFSHYNSDSAFVNPVSSFFVGLYADWHGQPPQEIIPYLHVLFSVTIVFILTLFFPIIPLILICIIVSVLDNSLISLAVLALVFRLITKFIVFCVRKRAQVPSGSPYYASKVGYSKFNYYMQVTIALALVTGFSYGYFETKHVITAVVLMILLEMTAGMTAMEDKSASSLFKYFGALLLVLLAFSLVTSFSFSGIERQYYRHKYRDPDRVDEYLTLKAKISFDQDMAYLQAYQQPIAEAGPVHHPRWNLSYGMFTKSWAYTPNWPATILLTILPATVGILIGTLNLNATKGPAESVPEGQLKANATKPVLSIGKEPPDKGSPVRDLPYLVWFYKPFLFYILEFSLAYWGTGDNFRTTLTLMSLSFGFYLATKFYDLGMEGTWMRIGQMTGISPKQVVGMIFMGNHKFGGLTTQFTFCVALVMSLCSTVFLMVEYNLNSPWLFCKILTHLTGIVVFCIDINSSLNSTIYTVSFCLASEMWLTAAITILIYKFVGLPSFHSFNIRAAGSPSVVDAGRL